MNNGGKRRNSSKRRRTKASKQNHRSSTGYEPLSGDIDRNTAHGAVFALRSVGLRPVESYGNRDGEWVTDVTILELLAFLDQEESQQVTWQGEAYDARMCHLDTRSMTICDPDLFSEGPLEKNLLVLVIHTTSATCGLHFSAIVVNATHKLVHAFDTLCTWSTPRIKYTLHQQFPLMNLLGNGYKIRNHTGKICQRGGTCGPWSLWICFAYALNFRGCRNAADDSIDYSCLEQKDVLHFWRSFTLD